VQFENNQLVTILKRQFEEVDVYDACGNLRGSVAPGIAARISSNGQFVGVGNSRRIRYVRPLGSAISCAALQNASRTTRRIRNDAGIVIAARPLVEHKPPSR
jgi:hypothetical protein